MTQTRSSLRLCDRRTDELAFLALYEAAVSIQCGMTQGDSRQHQCPVSVLKAAHATLAACQSQPDYAFDVVRYDAKDTTLWHYDAECAARCVKAGPQCDFYFEEPSHREFYVHYIPEVTSLARETTAGVKHVPLCFQHWTSRDGVLRFTARNGCDMFDTDDVRRCDYAPDLVYARADATSHAAFAVKHTCLPGCVVIRVKKDLVHKMLIAEEGHGVENVALCCALGLPDNYMPAVGSV